MSDLPSSGDETWDGHLLELITCVRDKKWHAALMAMNRMTKECLYRLKDSVGSIECENPVYPGTDRCGYCAGCKRAEAYRG